MPQINNEKELLERIALLEEKKKSEWGLVKLELANSIDSILPINLLKNSIKNVALMATVKEKLLSGAIGLVAGYVSKKVLFSENSPVKKIMGSLVQTGVTIEVSQETELAQMILAKIKSLAQKFISNKKKLSEGE